MTGKLDKPNQSEKGAALLSVLLLVAVMSIASVAILEVSLAALSKSRIVDARGQLNWQVTGAEEVGLVVVETLGLASNRELNDRTPNFRQTVTTPLPEGILITRLEEASNCFNINALRLAGEEDELVSDRRRMFSMLLTSLSFSQSEVEALTAGLVDWLDSDNSQSLSGAEEVYYSRLTPPYRPANVQIASITELRGIRGYSQELFTALRPLLCARNTSTLATFNINTLTLQEAPLLVTAFSGELSLNDAINLIEARPIGGWESVESMTADERIQNIAAEFHRVELLSIQSNFLKIEGQINLRDETLEFTTVYALPADQPAGIVRRMSGVF